MGFTELAGKVFNKGNYRTYVMNDFSIVTKAKFYLYTQNTEGGLTPINFNNREATTTTQPTELPVQINPSECNFSVESEISPFSGASDSSDKSLDDEESLSGSPFKVTGVKGSVFSIPLIFDVFDEYMARTANDSLPLDTISILDDNVTILSTLHNLAGQDIVARYVWGDSIDVYGKLKSVKVDITRFSRWGTPIKGKANVDLEIIKNSVATGSDVTAFGRAGDIATIAALVASEALR